MNGLELWAGVECSVVRVGDRYVDETELTGHARRVDDLDRLAALGARAVRYPVLWERTMPEIDRPPDFGFADERLARIRDLGMRPIVGLLHHGSGPRHTSLLDGSFVVGLAAFARAVAERYPWVTDYTPVNEPLTTARFSALYGHWYPHAKSGAAFVRALLVECAAIRAAMRAIREVQPAARLVQTEDIGTIFSTPKLAYQARFENQRRFASLDLLTGRLGPDHPLRGWFAHEGADERLLDSFLDDPCPPDVVGVNHYVTSDRFLDDRVLRYPAHARGGNGIDAYADVEAVRVRRAGIPGHRALLGVLFRRYGIPLAITEVHLGCTPEEQVRWLFEAWNGAVAARRNGVDVRAVTAWSAFGAFDWDTLLTRPRGSYEPGLFDVRGGAVRPTALAQVAADLAARGTSDHPALDEPGWWRRSDRLLYRAAGRSMCARASMSRRPILVTGACGTLGRAVARVAQARGLAVVALSRAELDVTDPERVALALDAHRPWAVVNAAGYVRVDEAEGDDEACMRANGHAAGVLAAACARRGVRLATFSSDLVFDGAKRAPYVESDTPTPLSSYGASKAYAERLVGERHPGAAIVRTSAFFGPWDEANFVHHALDELRAGRPFRAASDVVVSPTYVPDLADATLTLLVDGASGVWHLATPGAVTWFELARRAAALAGVPADRLVACRGAELALAAKRPPYSALASERGALLRPLDDALERFARTRSSG
jgi:dTDP-4-dehydrorhamnose reductase